MEMKNRSAFYEYQIDDKYDAGMVLTGTEVKSLRTGQISFNDSLEFLCIISSPVYTLFFLSITIIMQYVYKIKLVSSKCIIMFILCSYFFTINLQNLLINRMPFFDFQY